MKSQTISRRATTIYLPMDDEIDLHLLSPDADFVREFLAVMLVAEDEEPPLAAATTDESFLIQRGNLGWCQGCHLRDIDANG